MSVAGLCQVCEAAEARHQCAACGGLVCAEHFDAEAGLCGRCGRAGGGRTL